jgi:uncharacterized damage-inducible protein DinB
MDVVKLLEYNVWANRLIVEQVEIISEEKFEKDFGGSFGSIRATLVHLLESDWLWLNRFKGIALADVPDWRNEEAHVITKEWLRIQDEMLGVAKQMAIGGNRDIDFRTRKGQPFTMPFFEIITHISHHGSYHRGQLANMIRLSGEKPVSTDYFIFSVQRKIG